MKNKFVNKITGMMLAATLVIGSLAGCGAAADQKTEHRRQHQPSQKRLQRQQIQNKQKTGNRQKRGNRQRQVSRRKQRKMRIRRQLLIPKAQRQQKGKLP